MEKFQIKNRWSNAVIYECEAESFSACVLKAIDDGADLSGAYLSYANLSGANLSDANLSGANLSDADLSYADLGDANLSGADLSYADLSAANLRDANLSGANLSDAYLSGANLSDANLSYADLGAANLRGADLSGAYLSGAYLSGANLQPIRDDIWAVLCSVPREVFGLRKALIEGRVDGSTYSGPCACLVGTVANIRKCEYETIPTLRPNANRPAERFFLAIKKGDTPETNQFSALVVKWIDEWHALLSGNPFEGQDWPMVLAWMESEGK